MQGSYIAGGKSATMAQIHTYMSTSYDKLMRIKVHWVWLYSLPVLSSDACCLAQAVIAAWLMYVLTGYVTHLPPPSHSLAFALSFTLALSPSLFHIIQLVAQQRLTMTRSLWMIWRLCTTVLEDSKPLCYGVTVTGRISTSLDNM